MGAQACKIAVIGNKGQPRMNAKSANCRRDWKSEKMTDAKLRTDAMKQLEERYAYYRRCQYFRENGQQCKAPALRAMECGEAEFREGKLCWAHARQASQERTRAEQRRELLSAPGMGFRDIKSIQRTIAAVGEALMENGIDEKTAAGIFAEIESRLPKVGFGLGIAARKR